MSMEMIMDGFFDKVFSRLDRGFLMARHKRRQLEDHLSLFIQVWYKGEENCDQETACRRAVQAALRFHEKTCESNGQICMLGKYHNVLYVAAKLCFDLKLKDNNTVIHLLQEIYKCEETFERLFVGAIFGTRVTHLISGWKSDFESQEENIKALQYFTEHATKAQLSFSVKGEQCKFIDVPMESYGRVTPLRVAVQAGQADVLLILLHYGAVITFQPPNINTCALQPLLHRVNIHCHQKPDEEIPQEFVICLNILLRELRVLPHLLPDPQNELDELEEIHPAVFLVIAPKQTGYNVVPCLKHLCRCVIREELRSQYLLPYGINQLLLPDVLKKFLSHEGD